MFPLGTVLLPGGILPLHVFEPRVPPARHRLPRRRRRRPRVRRDMIERGWEVGGGDTRTDVGVVARMVQVEALPDGRYAVVAVGTRRIRILAWLPDDPYPLADVDDWPDEEPDARRSRRSRRGHAEPAPRRARAGGADGRRARGPRTRRSATTRCWPPTTSPDSRRSAPPTASGCSAPGHRPSASTSSPRFSTMSRRCCGSD